MERTDPAIIKLIFSVMNYIEVKESVANPFVKGFSRVEQDVDLAYRNMVNCLSDCQSYYPEVEDMIENILSELGSEQQIEIPNEQLDTTPDF